ncbi:hypothetical protein LCGC14_0953860 [marine sediment metagenome]|uniref:Uncharacterized protein n=1 Tax=marine sediment metagenome TaxID=412755 RepID=A0A0F9QZS8_9ZZZZ
MKLSSIIFYLGLFSLLSGLVGFIYWNNFNFISLIFLAILLNILSFMMEEAEKLHLI